MRLFSDVASRVEDPYLRRAITLAELGYGCTAPNPLVGCVIVRDGRIVGEGFHPRAGSPHAEVYALEAAGKAAHGSDAYVTLEPCRHHGRTPPCTDALIEAGIKRIVIGMPDPSAEAAGGADTLSQAGIEVVFAQDPSPFEALNDGWIKRLSCGVPKIIAKVALSLDGHAAFVRGERASVTGPAGAEVTRLLRSRSDAVLVGAATVISDDPALTSRTAGGQPDESQPMRVVLARSELPSAHSAVFSEGGSRTVLLVPDSMKAADLIGIPAQVTVSRYALGAGLSGALSVLGELGVNDLLIEPGPRLFTALWTDRLIDLLVTVTAGGVAGAEAPPLYLGSRESDGDALTRILQPREAGIVGDVAVTTWSRTRDAAT